MAHLDDFGDHLEDFSEVGEAMEKMFEKRVAESFRDTPSSIRELGGLAL